MRKTSNMVAHHHPPTPEICGWQTNMKAGLVLLREALDSAQRLKRDVWDFAVEIRELSKAGLNHTAIRWLMCMGYAEHAEERIHAGRARRSFRRYLNLALTTRSCFVLTANGVLWTADLLGSEERGGEEEEAAAPPRWDGALRRLCWKEQLVKQFRSPAPNQEMILCVFEEEGWPPHISDPLPPAGNIEPKARLHDAIKSLNRKQVNHLLCFRGDGNGLGVVWGATPRAAAALPEAPPDHP
jgi:hypothetical protein